MVNDFELHKREIKQFFFFSICTQNITLPFTRFHGTSEKTTSKLTKFYLIFSFFQDPSLSANSKSLGLPCTSKESPSLDREDACENSKNVFSQSSNETPETKLCLLCCSKPVNSSIIHGKFAHSISCFGCARRLQLKKRRCPICRRTIEKVVYQISA